MNNVINYPTIPTEIVVHLGAPDEAAKNISIPFIDYIKNVASSEIYPTWPDAAIEANILAQISFALNRIYNEWYPSRGYSFDITSLPAYDQSYIEDRQVFDAVSRKVDDLFNKSRENIENDFVNGASLQISHESTVVKLLKFIMNDQDDLIGYFIYELDYGRKYEAGMIQDENGKDIDISSSEKVYDYICKQGDVT